MPDIIFILADGVSQQKVTAKAGQTLLELAHQHNLDVEGVCEGSMACATCHMIIDHAFYDRLPAAKEQEEDLLDLTYGLKPTSRLGCQVVVTEDLDGMIIKIPAVHRNMML